ncbi:MAG: alpha/beta fold hydrolase, partial [Microthrixaceae bacterium]
LPDEVDLSYGPDEAHLLDVYRTDAATRRGTIVFVHGGGWTTGDKAALTSGMFGIFLSQLRRGFDLVSVEYRLAPEHPYPAARDDVALAVSWVIDHGAEHGIDTSRIVLAGHSAGGTLASMVATTPGTPTEFGTIPRVDRFVAVAAMSALTDEHMLVDFPGDWGVPDPDRATAAPLATIDATDPPGYLVHGDSDGFVTDWHSRMLMWLGTAVGARLQLDLIDTGTLFCRGHYSPCGADMSPFERFLG